MSRERTSVLFSSFLFCLYLIITRMDTDKHENDASNTSRNSRLILVGIFWSQCSACVCVCAYTAYIHMSLKQTHLCIQT